MAPQDKYPARSPDLNPTENPSGIAKPRMGEMYAEKAPTDLEVSARRFAGICKEFQDVGALLNMAGSIPLFRGGWPR